MNETEEQGWEAIDTEELRASLRRSHKWKSGLDQMPKFWMNYLIVLRVFGFMFYIIQNPEMTENWLPEGFICLLPMSEDTNNPKNYRPITCFTTRYKILTSMRTERMYVYLERNYILSQEQNGCKYQL